MEKDKKSVIRTITTVAKEYHSKLNGHQFLLIYQKSNDSIDYIEVTFHAHNFLHLTGINNRRHLNPEQFYNACIDNKLAENDIIIDSKGISIQKLKVLPDLPKLLYSGCMFGFNIGNSVKIVADSFIGNTRWTLSLGIRKCGNENNPVTLLRKDVREMTSPKYKVLAIFKRAIPRGNNHQSTKYSDITFIKNGINLEQLSLPDQIRGRLSIPSTE